MTDLKTLKDFEWNEEKPFYKCGHNRQIIILDSNLLSMSSYEIWKDSVGFNGDKSQCWECYCKDEEKIGCGKEMGGHNCGYCKICKEYY
jgi:7-cyano-7-deazaguanine synthase in queuosine biosynthesis